MIKFLLGFVAFVIVLLAAYMFTNKSEETAKKETITKVEKKDVSNKEVEVSEIKEVKTSQKIISVTKPSQNLQRNASKVTSMSNDSIEDTIGEGITLESIENADVSEEEKDRMRDDMAYYQSVHMPYRPTLNDEEILKLIKEDLKNGLIK